MQHLPSVRHLRHLMALADHGHFCRAAEACCVTQSTLSASIKELENVLEATLVDRTKRNVVLTPLGLDTVERARKIIVDFAELACAAQSARQPLCGTLRMGAIPTISPFLLPRVLPDLRRNPAQALSGRGLDDAPDRFAAPGQARPRPAGAALRLRRGRDDPARPRRGDRITMWFAAAR